MPAQALSQADIDQLAREGRDQLVAERGTASTITANQRAVRDLSKMTPYVFRGRKYRVRPLPWEDGLKLMELAAVAESLRERVSGSQEEPSPAIFRVYAATLLEILRIAHMLVRPRFVPAFIWRMCPNRFAYATQAEVYGLLRFCGRCQTISPDQAGLAEVPSTT